jgi:hypothetical protein
MNLAELRAELEADRAWREDEIRSFQNRGAAIDNSEELNRYRRALVLLLYAHFEGFCRFAFTLYTSAINRSGISCGEATHAIAAASLADLFRNLRNPQKKSSLFHHVLPDDSNLHQFAREREFIERTADVQSRPVNIPDNVVDTESNLTPVVLKKNLFRLGLPHDQFETYDNDINKLLGIRNGISHGSLRDGIEEKQYEQLRAATFAIISGLGAGIMKALSDKNFLRP